MDEAATEWLLESDDDNSSEFSLLHFEVSESSVGSIQEKHQRIGNSMKLLKKYSDADFRSNFRLYRSTAHILIDWFKQIEVYQKLHQKLKYMYFSGTWQLQIRLEKILIYFASLLQRLGTS